MLNRNNMFFHSTRGDSLWTTLLLSGALCLAAYASESSGAGANDMQEPASTELSLYDSITFDTKLSSSLAAKLPVVTVNVIAPFTANNIPERIDKWLNAVNKYGGRVELKPDPDYPASRNFGLIFDLLNNVYDLAKEMLIYSNAENYNLDVLYKPGSGELTRFVFILKEAGKP